MLEKQINDILTNGNASTAAERLADLFTENLRRPRHIELLLTNKAIPFMDGEARPETLTPSELVDVTTKQRGYDLITLILSTVTGAFVGAVAVYVFGGVQ